MILFRDVIPHLEFNSIRADLTPFYMLYQLYQHLKLFENTFINSSAHQSIKDAHPHLELVYIIT